MTRIILLAAALLLANPAPKYWQGMLRPPTAEWAGLYGTDDHSYLAYNAWVQRQLTADQAKSIAELKKQVEALQKGKGETE
jgi:hypothetical protein